MRRLDVVFLDSAQSDLNEIFQFVLDRARSHAVADAYVDRIVTTCETIGDAAEAGRPRDDLLPGLRTWSFERKAVIAYRVRANVVEITNVFAKGRDLKAFYARPSLRLRSAR